MTLGLSSVGALSEPRAWIGLPLGLPLGLPVDLPSRDDSGALALELHQGWILRATDRACTC